MVTRADVARRAGVSPAVVSYVLNGGPRPVAKRTEQRVLAAIRELNYTPNGVARSLRLARTRAVGLVVPDVVNAFFAQLAREIETAAFAEDITLILGNAMDDPAREQHYVRTLIERRVEGLVISPTGHSLETSRLLVRTRTPVVIIDRELPHSLGSTVSVDNAHGAYLATRHLIQHGHNRVAMIAGPSQVSSADDRVRGWGRALDEAGLASGSSRITRVPFTREAAHEAAAALFSSRRPPTAMFVSSDEQALGVYRAAAERGLAIAADVALTSFDSSQAAPYFVPSLTAVQQPTSEMAASALRLLIEHIADPDRMPTREVLPVELVIRRSCGCIEGVGPTP